MVGVTPFYNRNRNIMLSKIRTSRVAFPNVAKYGIKISDDCKDIILRLLEKKKEKRLGHRDDLAEFLSHPWFEGVKISDITEKEIFPPF